MNRYLDLIAGLESESEKTGRYELNEKNEINPRRVTPASILSACGYGSLTLGGLRDALMVRTGCTTEDAITTIEASEELGVITCAEDGLYRVVH